LGAALFVWYQLLENDRTAEKTDSQRGSLLGPACDPNEIRAMLQARAAVYRIVEDEDELCDEVAELIADGKVVGWVQGGMEFGPRALGNRSILGDARNPEMQRVMNVKIKFRESFRPFAPVVLRGRAAEFFQLRPEDESPYMLLVAPVRPEKRVEVLAGAKSALSRVAEVRSVVPAVTHVDHSARIQTVDEARNPRLRRLLEAFERRTGCPLLINTSFNVRGEPMVCSAEDAYRCFMATDLDVLVLGNHLLRKEAQPAAGRIKAAEYVSHHALD
jgi:carbamoyltransferase